MISPFPCGARNNDRGNEQVGGKIAGRDTDGQTSTTTGNIIGRRR